MTHEEWKPRTYAPPQPAGFPWSGLVVTLGIVYPISVVVINRNLPAWTNFDPRSPLAFLLINGATLLGLAVVVGTVLLLAIRRPGKNPGAGATIALVIVSIIAVLLLVLNASVWYGLYRLH